MLVREDTADDRRLVAYVVGREDEAASPAALRRHLGERLPEYMVPAAFVMMTSLPLTASGKIDRKALPAPSAVRAAAPRAEPIQAPSSSTEQTLVDIWQDVLGVPQVGLNDNFFDLGGHSLLTLQVHRRLKETIDVEISLVDLFRFPTISTLAGHIGSQTGSAGGAPTAPTAKDQKVKAEESARRGEKRREMLMRRQKARQK